MLYFSSNYHKEMMNFNEKENIIIKKRQKWILILNISIYRVDKSITKKEFI